MELKFSVDRTLGKLCKWLRIMGYDAAYTVSGSPEEIAEQCEDEERILFTRNNRLFVRRRIKKHAFLVVSNYLEVQFLEISRKYWLWDEMQPFTRCLKCNVQLEKITKEQIQGRVPDFVFKTSPKFAVCGSCEKIYWKGSHENHIIKKLRLYREICIEDMRIRKLQSMADVLSFEIMTAGYSHEEALNKVIELQQHAMELFPGQIETFKILYVPKFLRLIDQFCSPR